MAFTFGLERTWTLGLGLTVLLGGTAWMRSEEPANQSEPSTSTTAEPILAPTLNPPVGVFPPQQGFVPTMINSDAIPEHVAKDPVFQELSKAFLSTNQAPQSIRFSRAGRATACGTLSKTLFEPQDNWRRRSRDSKLPESWKKPGSIGRSLIICVCREPSCSQMKCKSQSLKILCRKQRGSRLAQIDVSW